MPLTIQMENYLSCVEGGDSDRCLPPTYSLSHALRKHSLYYRPQVHCTVRDELPGVSMDATPSTWSHTQHPALEPRLTFMTLTVYCICLVVLR